MVRTLLSHRWKKFIRSASFTKDTATLIFTGILAVMVLVYAFVIGFTLDIIIIKGLKKPDAIGFLNGLLLYGFALEFIMRYLMQNLPVLDIQPYLHLPIRKKKMIHFLLIRSAVHLFSVMPWILFGPFAFKVIAPDKGIPIAWAWIFTVWFASLFIHYLIIIFKKKLDDNIWGIIILLSLIVLFGAADYYQWFKLSQVSEYLFNTVLQVPLLVFVPVALIAITYFANFRFFITGTYPEELATGKKSDYGASRDISFLKNFGMVGEMINVEIKLIMRNKRPKNIMWLSAFFLFYGLLFYTNKMYLNEMSGILLFVGVFITGIFMINYGQLLYSWQGSHYDFTLTRPVSMRQYVESKYWLLSGVTLVTFVLSTPYVYFGWKILLVHLAMTLFNIGVNVFVILNLAMWDPKKVDMKKSITFNYEGIGMAQWIMAIPILAGPYVLYLPFSLMGGQNLGIAAVGLAGAIGFIFRDKLIDLTTKRLLERKYSIAANFRKD